MTKMKRAGATFLVACAFAASLAPAGAS